MGCFDEVTFDCPDCGTRLTVQSKAGKCMMATYDMGEVPMEIAADIDGQSVWCSTCEKSIRIYNPFGKVVRMLVQR